MGETKRNRGIEAECITQTKQCKCLFTVRFVVDKTSPWLGASPDFLIHDSTVHTPSEITQQMRLVTRRIFFLSKVDGKGRHSYYYQVQQNPTEPSILHIERIYFDKELWEKTMLQQLSEFYFEYLFQK